MPEKKCLHCDSFFIGHSKRKYCSSDCYREASTCPFGEGSVRTQYRQKERIGQGRQLKKFAIDESFFMTWSSEFAWFLGLFVTDGYCSSNQVSITSKDIDLLETLNFITKNERPVYMRKSGKAGDFIFRNKSIADHLKTLVVTKNKTFDLEMPNVPSEYFADFLRGVIDGDGTVCLIRQKRLITPRLKVSICGASRLKDGLSSRLNQLGFEHSIYFEKNKWNIQFTKDQTIKRLCQFIYPSKNIVCLERKRATFRDWLILRRNNDTTWSNPICSDCYRPSQKSSKLKSGKQYYRCRSCEKQVEIPDIILRSGPNVASLLTDLLAISV